jgi:hypothetical protein
MRSANAAGTFRACALTSTATTVIPYQEPPAKGDNVEFQSTLSSTLPMAAIFMRNKYIGWYAQPVLEFHETRVSLLSPERFVLILTLNPSPAHDHDKLTIC